MNVAECLYCNEVRSTNDMTWCEECEGHVCTWCMPDHLAEDAGNIESTQEPAP